MIELPLWLLLLILAFAAFSALERVLVPSVRWFFRRRMQKVVTKLNTRLDRPIEPFKLARRHDMIQQIIYTPCVMEAVTEYAHQEGIPENVAFEKATKYAQEIVPSFSASLYFGFAIKASKWLSTLLYRVRLGHFDEEAIKAIDPEATVIFVMNHRSNMDYVLVTYLAAERSALSYAVGEWARVWPLQPLIKSMGAYFIRRKSRNVLYRRVLARYVQLATQSGVTQAVFPEGGLSLDGTVHPPKLGLLNYMVSDFNPETQRDVVFVPVALNYDRVMEDRVLLSAGEKGDRQFGFSLKKMLGFVGKQIKFKFTGRYHRFGYAAVSFGCPLSMAKFVKDHPENLTEAVGDELMIRVRNVVPVLPVPLVATVLLNACGPISQAALVENVRNLANRLEHRGAHVHIPRHSMAYAADVGLRMLTLRHMVLKDGEDFIINNKEVRSLEFYAASIAHHLDVSNAKAATRG